MRLIVATKNMDKFREIKRILKGIKLPIVSLADLDRKFRLVENGKTFQANAAKKALPVSKACKTDYILGEDSGLEVNYLKGGPGIYSKRYSGKNATCKTNNAKLLKKLTGVKNRRANFICCIVLARGDKLLKVFEGKLNGVISKKQKGSNGFGYDPVLYLSKYKKTVAQLPISVKNRISHRSKAFGKLKKYLLTFK